MINPTRDNTDPVSSADANELSGEALDKGGSGEIAALDEETTPADADLLLLEKVAGEQKKVKIENIGGAEKAPLLIIIPAGSGDLPTSNPAPLDTHTATNITFKRNLFDDTTEEFIIAQIRVPTDIDASGTVNFYSYGAAVTADGNEIQLRFNHAAIDKNEDIDSASYTAEDSGDYVTSGDQNALDEVIWNETVSNLAWAAGDILYIKLSRIAIDDGTKLEGDWGFQLFCISIPRA